MALATIDLRQAAADSEMNEKRKLPTTMAKTAYLYHETKPLDFTTL
jgi:hypothetical protein